MFLTSVVVVKLLLPQFLQINRCFFKLRMVTRSLILGILMWTVLKPFLTMERLPQRTQTVTGYVSFASTCKLPLVASWTTKSVIFGSLIWSSTLVEWSWDISDTRFQLVLVDLIVAQDDMSFCCTEKWGCDITSLCISKWDEKPNFGFSSHLLTPLIFKAGPYRDQFHNV